jgi:hypothetical protein
MRRQHTGSETPLSPQQPAAVHAAPVQSQPASVSTASSQMQTPTSAQTLHRTQTVSETLHDIDYLDIPAFLRRKEKEDA